MCRCYHFRHCSSSNAPVSRFRIHAFQNSEPSILVQTCRVPFPQSGAFIMRKDFFACEPGGNLPECANVKAHPAFVEGAVSNPDIYAWLTCECSMHISYHIHREREREMSHLCVVEMCMQYTHIIYIERERERSSQAGCPQSQGKPRLQSHLSWARHRTSGFFV